jgi:hypothetical protein
MDKKGLSDFALSDQGAVTAVFSTLNVKDHDGDVTVPGAFEDGASVRISAYGHASWGDALPVGRGQIRMDGEKALLEGQFFMDTSHGRDTFATVKGLGDLGEWSYGYDVVDSAQGEFAGEPVRFLKGLKVHEVSPVLLGAGIGTRTLGTKSELAFSEQADRALREALAVIERAKAFGSCSTDEDRKAGRVLSAANRERLVTLLTALREAGGSLDELLAMTDPEAEKGEDAIRAAFLAEIRRRNHLTIGGIA